MTAPRTPAQVLAQSRRETSLRKRQAVLDTLQRMAADDEPVSFAAVARLAGVSTWLVYAEGVREHIEAAITRQTHQPVAARSDGRQVSTASLKTELALARQEIAEHSEAEYRAKAAHLASRVGELEAELAAARTSLRRMIREENR